jgi:glycosyltransferase involved in cell wall biosynthesis
MKIAVVTPYYNEPSNWLAACNESVRGQTHGCLHVMVADGAPRAEVDAFNADHIVLPRSHNDWGATPRLIGCYHAIGLGCDAVAFLDADCWYRRDHIESLVTLFSSTGASLVSSGRMLCRLDGSEMRACPLIDPEKFIDTNCMMVARQGFPVLAYWVLMPNYGHVIGDRIMLYHFKRAGLQHAHTGLPTVYYRAKNERLYGAIGEPAPVDLEPAPDYASAHRQWEAEGNPSLRSF